MKELRMDNNTRHLLQAMLKKFLFFLLRLNTIVFYNSTLPLHKMPLLTFFVLIRLRGMYLHSKYPGSPVPLNLALVQTVYSLFYYSSCDQGLRILQNPFRKIYACLP